MLGGNVDTVVFGVLEYEMFPAVGLFGFGAEELGDTVVDVNDVDAGLELLKLRSASRGPAVGAPSLAPDAENLGVGEDASGFSAVELQLEAGSGIAFSDDDGGPFAPVPGCCPLLRFVAGLDVGFFG